MGEGEGGGEGRAVSNTRLASCPTALGFDHKNMGGRVGAEILDQPPIGTRRSRFFLFSALLRLRCKGAVTLGIFLATCLNFVAAQVARIIA